MRLITVDNITRYTNRHSTIDVATHRLEALSGVRPGSEGLKALQDDQIEAIQLEILQV